MRQQTLQTPVEALPPRDDEPPPPYGIPWFTTPDEMEEAIANLQEDDAQREDLQQQCTASFQTTSLQTSLNDALT